MTGVSTEETHAVPPGGQDDGRRPCSHLSQSYGRRSRYLSCVFCNASCFSVFSTENVVSSENQQFVFFSNAGLLNEEEFG